MYKAYCCCCGKFVGEFITPEGAARHSGHCLECQTSEVNKVLDFVNSDSGE